MEVVEEEAGGGIEGGGQLEGADGEGGTAPASEVPPVQHLVVDVVVSEAGAVARDDGGDAGVHRS